MAADILAILIKANLAAGAAVLLVLIGRKVVRQTFGARIAYGFWLLVPLVVGASLMPAPKVFMTPPAVSPETFPVLAEAAAPVGTSTAISAPALSLPDPYGVLLGLWLVGLIASALLLIWRQHCFMTGLGGVRVDGAYLRAQASDAGPMVVGALRPRIILPIDFEERFEAGERDLVLAHEKAHLKAGDTRINGLVALVQCVAWFNPLVYVAARYLRLDQELACDAAVLTARPEDRLLYATALLKAQTPDQPLPLGCYWPAGDSPLKERIIMLKSQPPSRTRDCAGALIITFIGLGAGAVAWAAQPARVVVEPAQRATAPLQRLRTLEATAPDALSETAQTETAQSDAPSGYICLTNACMKGTSAAPPRDPAAVTRAIEAGDTAAVMIAGGTAEDIIAAMRSRLRKDPDAILNPDASRQIPLSRWMNSIDEGLNDGEIPRFIQNNGRTSLAFFTPSGRLVGVTTLTGMNGQGIPARGEAYDVPVPDAPPPPPPPLPFGETTAQ